jgi:hypothetical protein
MVTWPNQDKLVYGIVCGGDDKDPDPTESGGFRVYIPSEYGPGVKRTHLPFIRTMSQGTETGITSFNTPPERGSAVMCMKVPGHSGTGHLIVLGTLPNDINNDDTVPENMALFEAFPILRQAIEHKINILIPPNIVEKNKRGALVRVAKEKGVKHSHKLMKGIPSSGTLYVMNGYPIPQLNNISTAIDAFTAIVNKEIMEKLPGVHIDIADIIDLLPEKLRKKLEDALPPRIWNAMKAMVNLLQEMSFVETGGFLTSYKVSKKTYLVNAFDILKDIKDIPDLVEAFKRLQNDASLFGIDDIIKKIKIDSPWGKIGLKFDEDGFIVHDIADEVMELIKAFLGFLLDGEEFPSVLPGVNFFGEAAETFAQMLPRLTPKEFEKRKKLLEFAVGNKSDPRQKLNDYQKTVQRGGNILTLPHIERAVTS